MTGYDDIVITNVQWIIDSQPALGGWKFQPGTVSGNGPPQPPKRCSHHENLLTILR